MHGLPERIRSVDEIEPIFDVPDDPRLFHCIALAPVRHRGDGSRAQAAAWWGPTARSHDVTGLYVDRLERVSRRTWA